MIKKLAQPVDIIRELSSAMKPESSGIDAKLKKLKGVKVVLFNVYGTLFQSASGYRSLFRNDHKHRREALIRESIQAAGFQIQDEVTQMAELFNDTIRAELDIRRENEGIDHPEVDIVGVWEDFLGQLEAYEVINGRVTRANLATVSTYYESKLNPCWPMPNVQEAIETLLDKNISLGIVSNAQHFTPLLFEAFLGGSPHDIGFQELLCVWSYQELVVKPSTKLFEIATDRLLALDGTHPENVLVVGNDIQDEIMPAQQLGFKTALFAGDGRTLRLHEEDADCKGVHPDVVVTDLLQIPECV